MNARTGEAIRVKFLARPQPTSADTLARLLGGESSAWSIVVTADQYATLIDAGLLGPHAAVIVR